jgi:hypothetical protein
MKCKAVITIETGINPNPEKTAPVLLNDIEIAPGQAGILIIDALTVGLGR